MHRARAIGTAALSALGLALAPVCAPADPDAYAIFDQARHVWSAQHYPAYLSYTVAIHVSEGGIDKRRHYHLSYDAPSDLIDVNPVSDEEQASPPPAPTGFVLHLQPKRQGHVLVDKKVGRPAEAVDYLGVPKLSPTYAFGLTDGQIETGQSSESLVAQIRKEFNDPTPIEKLREQVTSGGMKTIAVVSTRSRAYAITLSGTQTVDGHDCYHLLLTPNRTPDKLRLRELWVDTQTSQTRQLLTAGNFTGSSAPWLVSFVELGGAMYIASESALGPIGVGEHRYEKADVAFQEIAPAVKPAHPSSFFSTNQSIMTEPDSGNHPH